MRAFRATEARLLEAMAEFGEVVVGATAANLTQGTMGCTLDRVVGRYSLGGSRADCAVLADETIGLYLNWAAAQQGRCTGTWTWS